MNKCFLSLICLVLLLSCNQKPAENLSDLLDSVVIEQYPFTLAPELFDSTLEWNPSDHENTFLTLDTSIVPDLHFDPRTQLNIIDTISNPDEWYDVTYDISRWYFYKRLTPINHHIEVLLYTCKNTAGNVGFIYIVTYDKRNKTFIDNKLLMINGFGDDIKQYYSGCKFHGPHNIESVFEFHFFVTDIIHRRLRIEQNGMISETSRRYEHKETWEEEDEDQYDYQNGSRYDESEYLPYELTGEEEVEDVD